MLEKFVYESGAKLEAVDLADDGVKISLSHSQYGNMAVILRPQKAREFGSWLLRGLSQPVPGMPAKAGKILARMIHTPGAKQKLRCGDKARFKEVLEVIKFQNSEDRRQNNVRKTNHEQRATRHET